MRMKKFFAKIKSANQDGSVLLAVLTIMTFASVLAATAFSFVQTANTRSLTNVREEQAYYTASTCLESFIDTIMTPDSDEWKMFEQIANGGGGTSSEINLQGMGKCVIDVEKPTGMSYIKVTATATVEGGESDSVVCYLKTTTVPVNDDFTNAVEIVGSENASQDNIRVVGDMSVSSDDPNKVFVFNNESKIYGKYFQYGTVAVTKKLYVNEGVNGEGSSLTASKYIVFSHNDPEYTSIVKKANDNKSNYLNAGNVFVCAAPNVKIGNESDIEPDTQIRGGAADVYCSGLLIGTPISDANEFCTSVISSLTNLQSSSGKEFKLATTNSYTQYGNIYCYANGEKNTAGKTDKQLAGNFVVDAGNVNIYGDVYVEGNLVVVSGKNLNIYGNLYVLGSIEGNVNIHEDTARTLVGQQTGKIYCGNKAASDPYEDLSNETFATFKSTPRGTVPSLEYSGSKYVYYPEDLMVGESEISDISGDYQNIVLYKDDFDMGIKGDGVLEAENSNVELDYTDPDTGVKFDVRIKESCYLTSEDMGYLRNRGKNSFLIEVSGTKDTIIVMDPHLALDNGVQFIIRNTTKSAEGSTTGAKPHFCYFVPDCGVGTATPVYKTDASGNLVNGDDGKPIVIDSTHTGFSTAGIEFRSGLTLLDYDTWYNVDLGRDILGHRGTKILNLTSNDLPEDTYYRPGLGYNIILLPEGSTFKGEGGSPLIEATVYAPQATVLIKSSAGGDVRFAAGTDLERTEKAVFIGSVIAGVYDTENSNYVLYCKPSSSSSLGKVKGNANQENNGYEVIKYTKDLS